MSRDPTELQGAIGFVLRHVDADISLGGLHDAAHVGLPGGTDIGVEEVGLRLVLEVEPVGKGEMPEGEQRFDACFPALPGHLGILTKGCLVDLPLLGLNACPFDSEAEMIHTKLLQGGQILVELTP